ncbi:hypothetical protein CKAN_00770300 [Cinnamomum micranthum f. kanehirae]|uniref:Uncharacterized protein n=1 Tax=Cinnamomum micranthum f. kanehirae TaxID=337451 RepID=A0A443NKX5_9MAGN|nr:hypothetical protein CKAN_00770300 [Cinnamomum micranthum f. kanehirae]
MRGVKTSSETHTTAAACCSPPEPFLPSSRGWSEEGRGSEEGSGIEFLLQKLEEEEDRFGLGLFFGLDPSQLDPFAVKVTWALQQFRVGSRSVLIQSAPPSLEPPPPPSSSSSLSVTLLNSSKPFAIFWNSMVFRVLTPLRLRALLGRHPRLHHLLCHRQLLQSLLSQVSFKRSLSSLSFSSIANQYTWKVYRVYLEERQHDDDYEREFGRNHAALTMMGMALYHQGGREHVEKESYLMLPIVIEKLLELGGMIIILKQETEKRFYKRVIVLAMVQW